MTFTQRDHYLPKGNSVQHTTSRRDNLTRLTAKYPGICPACQTRITRGTAVVKIPGVPGWVHDNDCVDAAEAKMRAGAWKRCGQYTKSTGRPCRNWVLVADATGCVHHQ